MIICLGMDGAGGEGDGKPQNENVYIDYDDVVFQKGTASGIASMNANNVSVRKLGVNILVGGVSGGGSSGDCVRYCRKFAEVGCSTI